MDLRGSKVSLRRAPAYAELFAALEDLQMLGSTANRVASRDSSLATTIGSGFYAGGTSPRAAARDFVRASMDSRRCHEGALQMLGEEATGRYHCRTLEKKERDSLFQGAREEEVSFLVRGTVAEETTTRAAIEAEVQAFISFATSSEPSWREAALGAQIQREQNQLVEAQNREAEKQRLESLREAELRRLQFLSSKSLQLLAEARAEKEAQLQQDKSDWFMLAELQHDEVQSALDRDRASQAEKLRKAREHPSYTRDGFPPTAHAYPSRTSTSATSHGLSNSASSRGSSTTQYGTTPGHQAGLGYPPGPMVSGGGNIGTGGPRYPAAQYGSGTTGGRGASSGGRGGGGGLSTSNNNYGSGGAALPTFVPTGTGPSSASTPYYNPSGRGGQQGGNFRPPNSGGGTGGGYGRTV